MSDQSNKDFEIILNHGADVDELFQDNRPPFGADPFKEAQTAEQVSVEQRKLHAYEKLSALITSEKSFAEMCSQILVIALEQVPSEAASFFECDYNEQVIKFKAVAGNSSEELLNITIPFGSGIVGLCVNMKQTIHVANAPDSAMHLKSIGKVVGFEARDVVAVPIVIRDESFGCIELLNRAGLEKFTLEDVEVIEAICTFGAKIIENRLVLAAFSRELSKQSSEKSAA